MNVMYLHALIYFLYIQLNERNKSKFLFLKCGIFLQQPTAIEWHLSK